MSIVLKSSSNGTTVTYMNAELTPSLKELQAAVGGFIEIVYMGDSQMIVDENGLVYNKPYNNVASELSGRHIVGNVVILNGSSKLN